MKQRTHRIRLALLVVCGMLSATFLQAQTIQVQIGSSTDDAEERGPNATSNPGLMDLTSSDIELVEDGNDGNQWVGLRFAGLNIPQGVVIQNAYIQFTVDETNTGQTDITFWAEDVDNAPTFTSTAFNISSRTRTADSVNWNSIPVWSVVGAAGNDQRSPNLAALVQAIINRPGWASGNALAMIVHGAGERTAESYDGSSADAPVLTIEYTIPLTGQYQVASSSDDAEERGSNATSSPGLMDLTSSDLELVRDGNDGDQWVGMRFTNVDVPQGSIIYDAYIQFTVDEDDSLTGPKYFWAEAADNASTYTSTAFNISSRPRTVDSVLWDNIPYWPTVGAAGVDQRSSNIASVVQEVISRSGWSSGNALNILVHGSGERVAESYDGSSSSAPVLHLKYLIVQRDTIAVGASNDDAEQDAVNNGMSLTSTDLELTTDGTSEQAVAVRFDGVSIPQGATVTNAYIQFTVDEVTTSGTVSTAIFGELSSNASPFTGAAGDIVNRSFNNTPVFWDNIPGWTTVGAAGPDQRTPNLAPLVQEIVDQPNWAPGNAMVLGFADPFILSIPTYTGNTGKRTAESFDGGGSAQGPKLIVEYLGPTVYLPGEFPVAAGSDWKFDDSGTDLGTAWTAPTYNDSSWDFGPAILGYNNGNESTTLDFGPNANNKYPTYYLRNSFTVVDPTEYDSLIFRVLRDDGVIVYVNGTEAFRMNMPGGTVTYNSLASGTVGGADETNYFEVTTANLLVAGMNHIAVELHQASVTSSDLSFDMEVIGKLPPLAADTFPVSRQADWSYLDNNANLTGTNWNTLAYNDDFWSWGAGPLGYSNPVNTTVSYGSDPNNKHITTWFRKTVWVNDVNALTDSLWLRVLRDDGVIVYINGQEVVRDNMPAGAITQSTLAPNIVSGSDETSYYSFFIDKAVLQNGMNVIAAEVHQRDAFSSDLSFDLSLEEAPVFNPPGLACTGGNENHISCFTSIPTIGQSSIMTIPSSHRFQMIFQQGDAYTKGGGTVAGNHDFTGYIPNNGSSREGWVSVNHENTPGGVSILDVHYVDSLTQWIVDTTQLVDMYNSDLVTTTRNCSGGVTPWETVITCEETYNSGDANSDGYQDVGWNVEIDPRTKRVREYGNGMQEKLWAMGRMSHENVVVASDRITVYYGEDGGSSCVFKFVADQAEDLSTGTLYVLVLDSAMVGGEPTGTTGQWVQVPNTTQADLNNTRSLAISLGGTNFSGVEDVEISPLDGKTYFTSKGRGRIYRFTDTGMGVSDFETFVGGATYPLTTTSGVTFEPWGGGNDNLDFDDLGNLWVLQDGGQDYIWMVRPDHTQNDPKIELFMSTPNGSEPTGITFSPDYRFMFVSIQHPSSANTTQVDGVGNTVAFNASATVVIAREQFLGPQPPRVGFISTATVIDQGETVTFTDTSKYGITGRSWAFSGGFPFTATGKSETITYPNPGVYDVSLSVTNASGNEQVVRNGFVIVNDTTSAPTGFELPVAANEVVVYPNPVRQDVKLYLNLTETQEVEARLFDLNGRLIGVMVNQQQVTAGVNEFSFPLASKLQQSQPVILQVKIGDETTQKTLQFVK